jgi:hypothetical protein
MNIGYNGNKRELYIIAPEREMNIGYNCNKRELYINVTGKDILAKIVKRDNCT